jgi:hypothetical protein
VPISEVVCGGNLVPTILLTIQDRSLEHLQTLWELDWKTNQMSFMRDQLVLETGQHPSHRHYCWGPAPDPVALLRRDLISSTFILQLSIKVFIVQLNSRG